MAKFLIKWEGYPRLTKLSARKFEQLIVPAMTRFALKQLSKLRYCNANSINTRYLLETRLRHDEKEV